MICFCPPIREVVPLPECVEHSDPHGRGHRLEYRSSTFSMTWQLLPERSCKNRKRLWYDRACFIQIIELVERICFGSTGFVHQTIRLFDLALSSDRKCSHTGSN